MLVYQRVNHGKYTISPDVPAQNHHRTRAVVPSWRHSPRWASSAWSSPRCRSWTATSVWKTHLLPGVVNLPSTSHLNPWMMWMNVGWMYWINGSKIVGHCKSCPTNSGELHPTLRCDPTSVVVLNNIAHMWLLLGRWRNEKKCTACTFHRPIRLYPTSTWKMFQEKRMQKVMFQDLNRKRNGLERWCWKMTAKDLQSADWIIYIDHGDVHWTCFQFWATNNSS